MQNDWTSNEIRRVLREPGHRDTGSPVKREDILICQDQGGFLEEVTGRVTRNCCNILVHLDFALKELSS